MIEEVEFAFTLTAPLDSIALHRLTILRSEIIDELISFTKVCRSLWAIEFLHLDDGYHPDNHARDLTDDTIVRLAAACPNLRSVKFRAATQLGHRSLIAFCQYCPGLKHLQITGEAANQTYLVHEEFFDEVARLPSWAPQLKKVVLYAHRDSYQDRVHEPYLKHVRALSRARPKMVIEFHKILLDRKPRWTDPRSYLNTVVKTGYVNGRKNYEKYSEYTPDM